VSAAKAPRPEGARPLHDQDAPPSFGGGKFKITYYSSVIHGNVKTFENHGRLDNFNGLQFPKDMTEMPADNIRMVVPMPIFLPVYALSSAGFAGATRT